MNIGIDTFAILGPNGGGGIGFYVRAQLQNLFEADKENQYFIFNRFPDKRLADVTVLPLNVKEVSNSAGPWLHLFEHLAIAKHMVQRFLFEHSIDLFYATEPMNQWLTYKKEWFRETKLVCAIYDMIPLQNYLQGSTDWIFNKPSRTPAVDAGIFKLQSESWQVIIPA